MNPLRGAGNCICVLTGTWASRFNARRSPPVPAGQKVARRGSAVPARVGRGHGGLGINRDLLGVLASLATPKSRLVRVSRNKITSECASANTSSGAGSTLRLLGDAVSRWEPQKTIQETQRRKTQIKDAGVRDTVGLNTKRQNDWKWKRP